MCFYADTQLVSQFHLHDLPCMSHAGQEPLHVTPYLRVIGMSFVTCPLIIHVWLTWPGVHHDPCEGVV